MYSGVSVGKSVGEVMAVGIRSGLDVEVMSNI